MRFTVIEYELLLVQVAVLLLLSHHTLTKFQSLFDDEDVSMVIL